MGNDATLTLKGERGPLKSELDKAQQDVEGFGTKIKGIFIAIGTAIAAKKIFDFGKELMEAAAEAEEAQAKVDAALKASGGAAGYTSEQLAAMADQMERTVNIEAEVVQGAQEIALGFTNIRGDAFKKLMDLAADASTTTGDLKSNVDRFGKALNDPIRGMQQLAGMEVVFTEAEQKAIAAMVEAGDVAGAQAEMFEKLRTKIGDTAEAAAGTSMGKWKAFQIQLGNMGEEIGGALLPILDELTPNLKGIADWMSGAVVPVVKDVIAVLIDWGKTISGYLLPAFEVAIDGCVALYTGFQYMQDVVTVAVEGLVLGVVKAFNVVAHQLTEVIPEYLAWFARNWTNVFRDAAAFVGTVFGNMYDNITSFFKGVYSMLKGGGFDFKWTGLTEGFEATMEELPKIAERRKGDLEKALEDDLSKNAKKLGFGSFLDRLESNRNATRKFFRLDGSEATSGSEAGSDTTPDATKISAPYEVTMPKSEAKASAQKESSQAKEFKATFEDLEGLNKRIQAAAASGKTEEKLDKVAKAVESKGDEQVRTAKDSKSTLDEIKVLMKQTADGIKKLVEIMPNVGTLA